MRNRAGTQNSIIFSSLSILGTLGVKPRNLAGSLTPTFLILTVISAAISLARPQLTDTYTERKASGIDIVIAMDVSTSMEIDDFIINGRRVDRTTASREVVRNFIKQRPNDRIGLIPFAGQPYQESPITLEHDWLLEKLDSVQPRQELSQGTAIGSAIAASAIRLDKREDSKSRIIILITDGSNNSGRMSPITSAKLAKDLGIRVYTVAIGTKEGRLPRYKQPFPSQEFDTKTLEEIAAITNAQYYRAKSTEDLESTFSTIDQLEKTDVKRSTITERRDLHFYFTAAALAFLLVYAALCTFVTPPSPN